MVDGCWLLVVVVEQRVSIYSIFRSLYIYICVSDKEIVSNSPLLMEVNDFRGAFMRHINVVMQK